MQWISKTKWSACIEFSWKNIGASIRRRPNTKNTPKFTKTIRTSIPSCAPNPPNPSPSHANSVQIHPKPCPNRCQIDEIYRKKNNKWDLEVAGSNCPYVWRPFCVRFGRQNRLKTSPARVKKRLRKTLPFQSRFLEQLSVILEMFVNTMMEQKGTNIAPSSLSQKSQQ